MHIVPLFLIAAGAYLAVGLLFAAAFVSVGISEVDRAADDGPIGFRLLIVPGAAALWPYLAIRWRDARRGRTAS